MKKHKPFDLHHYPYIYRCPDCKKRLKKEPRMELEEDHERTLKHDFKVKSELPLFFICDFCHSFIMKPDGYTGAPSKVINLGVEGVFYHLFMPDSL